MYLGDTEVSDEASQAPMSNQQSPKFRLKGTSHSEYCDMYASHEAWDSDSGRKP